MQWLLPAIFVSLIVPLKAQVPNYIPILVENKYGFCDSAMNMLLPPVYKKVIPMGKHYLVQQDKKYFLLDPVTGKTTPGFDAFLPVNTYTKNSNAWKNFALYFTNPEILINQYWFRKSNNLYAAIAADSLLIYDTGFAVTAVSRLMPKGKLKDVLLLDSVNGIYCVRQVEKETVKYIRIFNTDKTLKANTVNGKDQLTVYPIGKHYLAECRDERCALLKINGNGVDTLTGYNYYLIELDTMNETFRCLPYDDKTTDSTENVIFTSIDYLDSKGRKFYGIPYNYNAGTEYHDKLQERMYSGPTLLPETPYIDNKIIVRFIWGIPTVLSFIDSPNTYYSCYRAGKNYVIGGTFQDTLTRNYIGRYGLINNSGEILVPLKYNTERYQTDSVIIFRDVKDILITDLEGKTITTIKPGPDTIVQVSYTHSPRRLFQLHYSVMEYGNYRPLKTEWWKYRNGEFKKLTDSEVTSLPLDRFMRSEEEIAEIQRLADLHLTGGYTLEHHKSSSWRKWPIINYYKLKDSTGKTVLKNITSPFKLYLDYPGLYYATISSGKKLRYIFINKNGTLYYRKKK